MKKLLIVKLFLLFSCQSFANEIIGGWGAYHFGMKQSDVEIILSAAKKAFKNEQNE